LDIVAVDYHGQVSEFFCAGEKQGFPNNAAVLFAVAMTQ